MAESSNTEHHKFRFPITVQRTNSHLLLSSGSVSSKIALDELDLITFKGTDAEGFVSFEVRSRANPSTDGFVLFYRDKATSRGQGSEPSTYNYFKKASTEEYAFVVASKEEESPRHVLGSIHDKASKIARVLAECPEEKWFRRNDFPDEFSVNQQQLLKACLDILTKEGILTRRNVKGDKRTLFEYYKGVPPITDLDRFAKEFAEVRATIVNSSSSGQ